MYHVQWIQICIIVVARCLGILRHRLVCLRWSLLYVLHDASRYVIVLVLLQCFAMCMMSVAMYMGILWIYLCVLEIDVALESMVSVGIPMGILLGHVS